MSGAPVETAASRAPSGPVVLFDGQCNLCAGWVRFVLDHEAAPALRFAPSQSEAGARLIREFGLGSGPTGSIVLIEDGRAFTRSDATLRIARYLAPPWRFAAALRIVPRPVRDAAYAMVARTRHRWFGRRDTCMVPAPEVASRFLA